MSSDTDYLSEAEGENIDDGIIRAILAPILALGGGLAMLVESGLAGISDLFEVFGDVREFLGALFTEPLVALEIAAQATGVSSEEFGILAIPVVMASIAIGLVIVDTIFGNEIPVISVLNPFN